MAKRVTVPKYNADPTAVDDGNLYSESSLLASGKLTGNVLTMDVMANDGATRPKLYSLDDGLGNTTQDLLASNMTTGWEPTAGGNLVRINRGQLQFDMTPSLTGLGLTSVSQMTVQHGISDSFTYAIQLGDGTLQWATVTFKLLGEGGVGAQNDTGTGTEDASAWFTVLDNDSIGGAGSIISLNAATITTPGEGQFLAGYASALFVIDTDPVTGKNAIRLDPGTAFNSLSQGEQLDLQAAYTMRYVTGGESQALLTVTVTGVNDPVSVGAQTPMQVNEDDAYSANLTFGYSDPDRADTHSASWSPIGSTVGTLEILGASEATHEIYLRYIHDPQNPTIMSLGDGESLIERFNVTVADGRGGDATTEVAVTIVGANEQVLTNQGSATGGIYADTIGVGPNDFYADTTMYGLGGDDKLYGGAGNDTLIGDEGNDVQYGGNGSDILRGDDGNDRLVSGAGDDELYGGAGSDRLESESTGEKFLSGGEGVDELLSVAADAGAVTWMSGGGSNDYLLLGVGTDHVMFDFTHSEGVDIVYGFDDASGGDLGSQDFIRLSHTAFNVATGTTVALTPDQYLAYNGSPVAGGSPAVMYQAAGNAWNLYYWDGTAPTPVQFAIVTTWTGDLGAEDILIVGSPPTQQL